MSKLKSRRELRNLTQEELSEKSGVSVRTIQRIESGKEPKGYTLRVLAKALDVEEKALQNTTSEIESNNGLIDTEISNEESTTIYSKIKLINLSSLPFMVLPLMNIIVPLVLAYSMKVKSPITKQIVSLQIMWTIAAPIVFLLGIFLKLGHQFTLVVMIAIALSNVYLILRNAIEIDRNKKLRYKLNFNMI